MAQQLTPDVLSFQRLLEAAWVLQCEHDLELRKAAELETFLEAVESEPPRKMPQAKISVAPPPNSRPVTMGSLALAPERFPEPPLNLIPFLAPDLRKSPQRAIVPSPLILALANSRNAKYRFLAAEKNSKLIHRALVIAAPMIVFLVMGVFLFQLASHRHFFRKSQGSAAPVNAPASNLQQQLSPTLASTTLGLTHLRVTDADTSASLESLSRYELRTLRRQASFGDDVAALTLGMVYETGALDSQDCRQAAHWVTLAAEQGNPAAQYNLALRYSNGDGLPENPDLAKKWLQESARLGYPAAQTLMRAGL
jgi:hypothetical protein